MVFFALSFFFHRAARDAVLDVLARFSFLRSQIYTLDSAEAASHLSSKAFEQEKWRQDVRYLDYTVAALHVRAHLWSLVEYLRHDYLRAMHAKVLTFFQSRLAGSINLSLKNRTFIAEGELVKVCAGNELRPYHVLVLGDVFLYSSPDGATKLKVHRVIQLACCKLVDIVDNTDGTSSVTALAMCVGNRVVVGCICPYCVRYVV
jgi:hypothetical protein